MLHIIYPTDTLTGQKISTSRFPDTDRIVEKIDYYIISTACNFFCPWHDSCLHALPETHGDPVKKICLRKWRKTSYIKKSRCNNRVCIVIALAPVIEVTFMVRIAVKKIALALLLSLAAVSLLPVPSPGSHARGGNRAGQIDPAALPGTGNTCPVLGGPLQASFGAYVPSVDASGTAFRRNIAGYDSSTNSFDVTASLKLFDYKRGYTPAISRLQLQLRTGRPPQEPPGPRVQREVLFLHDPGNPAGILEQRKIQLENALKNYEVAKGGENSAWQSSLDVLPGFLEIGAGPLQTWFSRKAASRRASRS